MKTDKKKRKRKSFIKQAIERRLQEATRQATANRQCACSKSHACAHDDARWVDRIERLKAVRGELAVALITLPSDYDFWTAVDGLPKNSVRARPSQGSSSSPKSGVAVSIKIVLRDLTRKAREKVAGSAVAIAGADLPKWQRRLETLEGMTPERAVPLLPHVKSSTIWDAVDLLETPPEDRRSVGC